MKQLAIVFLMIVLGGCATYRPGELPYHESSMHQNAQTKKDVTVAVKVYGCREMAEVFDCGMCKRRIEPLFIAVENNSSNSYFFERKAVDRNFIAAKVASKKCARRHGGRVFIYGIFEPIIGNVRRVNRKMKEDYTVKEITDGVISPGEKISGVVYVPISLQKKAFVSVPLVDQETNERLVFEFERD